MGLKDFFVNAKTKIHNWFEEKITASDFRSEISSLEADLRYLDEKISISNKALECNDYLYNYYPDKYSDLLGKFNKLKNSVEKHNADIEKINTDYDSFSFEDILKNPYSFEIDSLNKYNDTYETIKSYGIIAKRYSDFCDQIDDLKKNLNLIRTQFDKKNQCDEILKLDENHYYDIDDANLINKKLEPITTLIADKKYYDFSMLAKIDEIISAHNDEYVNKGIANTIFDNINGKSLDTEQREAVLRNEKSALTIAGAGSGKTLTICGKVKYLLEEEKAKPEDILLLSYSKKSALDLETKVSVIDSKLTVGTFHKLGLDILKEANKKSLTVEEQFGAIIEEFFRDELQKDPKLMSKVLNYYGLYISANQHIKKYKTLGEQYEDLKKTDLRTMKSMLNDLTNNIDKKETIKKELVKSFEELALANFYFINGINYEYEAPYKYETSTLDKRQYTPDFYLRKYDLYHEHYGLDERGMANQFSGEEARRYREGVAWKRQVHIMNKTNCIETFSYEFENGTIFTKLEKELKSRGVQFKPLTKKQVSDALNSIYLDRNFSSFINLLKSFISLYKAKYRDDTYFDKFKNSEFNNKFLKERATLFIDIAKEIYRYYKNKLRESNKIDFDDMILDSIEELNNVKGFKYKYIIVDEFQDISFSRMKFLKKLIEKGNAKLFAVGDDWQAIYRFSGCDLDIFVNFDNYFGYSAKNYITSTHRNSQELQDIVGPFIKKNPEQFSKVLKSKKHLNKPLKVAYYYENKFSAFASVLDEISKLNKKAKILVLGRNNFDIKELLNTQLYLDKKSEFEGTKKLVYVPNESLDLTYSTVHSSKGLEEDYVILINADDCKLGFPNKVEDDDLLNLVLSSKSNFQFAEERRLWYVALTRTRSFTYIIADKNNPSMFLKEIIDECDELPTVEKEQECSCIPCPKCRGGKLVMRVKEYDRTRFYGCSNYPYCKYTINDFTAVKNGKKCPECGDYMIFKKGKYGAFFSCNSFPHCRHTEKYEKN